MTTLAWGLFFILVGGAWIYGEAYHIDTGTVIAIGVGLILIGLNLARSSIGVRMSKFSLALGILALLIGLARSLRGYCVLVRALLWASRFIVQPWQFEPSS